MLVVVLELREERNERVLRAEYEVVVQPPINLAHAARWMPEALQGVLENLARAEGHAERLNRVKDVLRDVRRRLEDVRPHVIDEVNEGVFAAETVHAEGHVLHRRNRCLAMDQIPIDEGILKQRSDR